MPKITIFMGGINHQVMGVYIWVIYMGDNCQASNGEPAGLHGSFRALLAQCRWVYLMGYSMAYHKHILNILK